MHDLACIADSFCVSYWFDVTEWMQKHTDLKPLASSSRQFWRGVSKQMEASPQEDLATGPGKIPGNHCKGLSTDVTCHTKVSSERWLRCLFGYQTILKPRDIANF